jgi:hypothetical protein
MLAKKSGSTGEKTFATNGAGNFGPVRIVPILSFAI